MSPLSAFPSRHIAGDTLVVERPSNIDALVGDGWNVALTLLDIVGRKVSVTASESGGDVNLFTVAAREWNTLKPGPVTWAVTATKDSDRLTFESGTLILAPDPTEAESGSRSKLAHIERVIAACEARIEGKLTDDVQMYQLPDGVTVSKLTLKEVRETLALYKSKRSKLLRGGRPRVREPYYRFRG